jgi:hypothetical protein
VRIGWADVKQSEVNKLKDSLEIADYKHSEIAVSDKCQARGVHMATTVQRNGNFLW